MRRNVILCQSAAWAITIKIVAIIAWHLEVIDHDDCAFALRKYDIEFFCERQIQSQWASR